MTKHEILTDGVAGEDLSEKKVYEAPILRMLDAEDTANATTVAADGGATSS